MFVLFAVLFAYAYLLTPVLVVLAWVRLGRSPRKRSHRTRLSLVALTLATLSFLLGIIVLAMSTHNGTLAVDSRFGHTYEAGLTSAGLALLLGLLGVRNPNPLRWQAPAVSLGCLCLWFLAGSGS